MEQQIREFIAQKKREGKLLKPNMKVAVFVQELSTGRELVSIREDEALQTASMIKPFVALAFFHKVKQGKLKYDDTARRKLVAMLKRSSNSATNWFFAKVGGAKEVDRILKTHYGRVFQDGKVVENIPPGGRTYKNRASAEDYARFNRSMWKNALPGSDEMMEAMGLPKRNRMYVGVPEIPKGTEVIDKTGTTGRAVGDMGIVVAKRQNGKEFPYLFSMTIETPKKMNSAVLSQKGGAVIRDVSGMVYAWLKDEQNLL